MPTPTFENCVSFDDVIMELIPTGFQESRVLKVYDGDTAWFSSKIGRRFVRIKGRFALIDTAEIRGASVEEKTFGRYVRDLMTGLIEEKDVLLEIHELDKYHRFVVTVYINEKDFPYDFEEVYERYGLRKKRTRYINLNRWMLDVGLAEEYN